jgi:hypothetical protein
MAKSMFDAEALISSFESANAQQSQQLRKAVSDATMAALQGRELTLRNIRSTLKSVSDAAGTGAAKNTMAGVDVETLLDTAVAGMDDALLKAVDANRVALQQLAAQGADLRDKHLKKAIADLDRFEDTLIESIRKSAGGAGAHGQGRTDRDERPSWSTRSCRTAALSRDAGERPPLVAYTAGKMRKLSPYHIRILAMATAGVSLELSPYDLRSRAASPSGASSGSSTTMAATTFFWHDYETFGRVPRRDRPAQFAGVRTDADLNEIGEPVMLHCRPRPTPARPREPAC